jgi:hypothetical protein
MTGEHEMVRIRIPEFEDLDEQLREDLRDLWRTWGGAFHGPKVETGTMPESRLLPLIAGFVAAAKEKRSAECVISQVAQDTYGRSMTVEEFADAAGYDS